MNLTFKAAWAKEWTLTNDKIIIGKKEILISSITNMSHSPVKRAGWNGSIQLWQGDFHHTLLIYPSRQEEDGVKAANYIAKCISERTLKTKKEFKKRCAICGRIFCYTFEDLEENKRKAYRGLLSSAASVAGSLSGNYAAGAINHQTAQNTASGIIDYDQCPSCGSRNLIDVTDEDISKINAQQNGQPTISSADELRKFKELLDMGAITQEEFDAKKKQLLGL